MSSLLLGLAMLLSPLPAACDEGLGLRELTPGQYAMRVSGMLCTNCARAIGEELKRLKQVEPAGFDWDRQEIHFAVRPGQVVRVSTLKHALTRARARINLVTSFKLERISYRVLPKVPGSVVTIPSNGNN